MRVYVLLSLSMLGSLLVTGEEKVPYRYELKIRSTTFPHFISEFSYPEWQRYPNSLISMVSPSISIRVKSHWRGTIGYRQQNSGANLFTLFDNIPWGVQSPKPIYIKAHYYELTLQRNLYVTNKIRLSPELGLVYRRMRYTFAKRLPTEILYDRPTSYTKELGVRYSTNIDFMLDKSQKVGIGICGSYYAFAKASTWLIGWSVSYNFNSIRKIIIKTNSVRT
ncbi:MAG: hypothetical protein ACI9NN_000480 [Bacteroidia bacterium]|jgi:hypothetical protein